MTYRSNAGASYARCTDCLFATAPDGAWQPEIVAYVDPDRPHLTMSGETLDAVQRRRSSVVQMTVVRARAMMHAFHAAPRKD